MLINIERERDKSIYYRNIYDTTTIFTLTNKTQTLSDNNNSQSDLAPMHRNCIHKNKEREDDQSRESKKIINTMRERDKEKEQKMTIQVTTHRAVTPPHRDGEEAL